MLPLLLLLIGAQADDVDFARHDERLRARRYVKLLPGPPVRPLWRKRSGPIEAWTFPDGVAEHYRVYHGRALQREVRLDLAGRPLTTVHFDAARRPSEVVVHGMGDDTVSIEAFEEIALGEVALWVPPGGELSANAGRWELPHGVLRAQWVPGSADPFSQAYGQALQRHCDCLLVDRGAAWIDGEAAARYQVAMPGAEGTQRGLVWALPLKEAVLLVSWIATEDDLAPGRAVVALINTKPR